MSLQRQVMSSDELDRLLGARVVHIERQPSATGEPGAFHWVLSLRELPGPPLPVTNRGGYVGPERPGEPPVPVYEGGTAEPVDYVTGFVPLRERHGLV